MEYYNNILCVTVGELTDGVISLSNYKYYVRAKAINVVRVARGLGCYALVEFNSMPDRIKQAYMQKYGNPNILCAKPSERVDLVEDVEARVFFTNYTVDGVALSDEKINEYTLNASVLQMAIKQSNSSVGLQRACGGRGASIELLVMGVVDTCRVQHNHTLPSSYSRIKKKIAELKKVGYSSLIEGYVNNNNARKICAEAGAYIVALKRSKVPQYNNAQIFAQYNLVAKRTGWKELKSVNSLVNYLNKPEVMQMWHDAKHGEKATKLKYMRKHITAMPQQRDSLWYGDGTKLNLYYKAYDERGRLQVKTTQVYEVMDAFSEVFIGYCISDSENYQSQYTAYRMAVETAGCRPYELVFDNQGGHKKLKAASFFDKISKIARTTAPYNPSSKSIESAFGRFQAQVLARDWRFTGQNITAKSGGRVDVDFVLANKESLYTLEELKERYAAARDEWNAQPHHATKQPRLEMYQNSVNQETSAITQVEMIDIFWRQTEKAVTFTTSGITINIDGKKYTYEVYDEAGNPDLAFRRKYTYAKFVVKYDPQALNLVRLYSVDHAGSLKFVSEARPYFVIHRAIQEQEEGERAFISQQMEAQNEERIRHHLALVELEMKHGVAPEQHGLIRPGIAGISKKDTERLMDKITAQQPLPPSIGAVTKELSNRENNDIERYNKL